LPRRAIQLPGRVTLGLDTIATLKTWLQGADPEEQKSLKKQLRSIEWQNDD